MGSKGERLPGKEIINYKMGREPEEKSTAQMSLQLPAHHCLCTVNFPLIILQLFLTCLMLWQGDWEMQSLEMFWMY